MPYSHPTVLRKVNVSWSPRTNRWKVRDGSNDKALYELRRVWLHTVRFLGVNGCLEGRLVSLVAPKEPNFKHRLVQRHSTRPYYAYLDNEEPIVAAPQVLCGPANVIYVPER